jgi:hypothetical protein
MADREKQLRSLYKSMYESVQKIESMSRHVRDVSAVFGANMTEERKRWDTEYIWSDYMTL